MKNTHYIKYASIFNFSSSAIQNLIDIQFITKLKARVGVSASRNSKIIFNCRQRCVWQTL